MTIMHRKKGKKTKKLIHHYLVLLGETATLDTMLWIKKLKIITMRGPHHTAGIPSS